MPMERLPFANLMSSHERLGGASPAAMNVVVDANGVLRRRPGIQTLAKAGTGTVDSGGIYGLFATSLGRLFAVGGAGPSRTIYRIAGGSSANVAGVSTMVCPSRPVFAETEALVVIAGGSFIHKVELAGVRGSALGGSPPKASHVIFNASRLLANDVEVDRSKVNYSFPAAGTVFAGHEVWGSFFSAEARPDPVVALGENGNEVFVWGSTNLEVYGPDGLLIFGRGAVRDYGCSAPYSITRFDTAFAWLDHRRRIIVSDGRTVTPISDDIEPELDAMGTVSDCFGYRISEGMVDCLVFSFPTEGQTFCYQTGVGWSKWATWSNGQWGAFPVLSHAHDPTTDANVVGLSSGRVCQMSDGVADDLGDNIHAYVQTGSVNHGTSSRKLCKRVRFTMERGRTSSSVEPVALLQWADAPGQWSAPRQVGLGRSGETNPVVSLESLGAYRERFWKLTFSEGEHMAVAHVEEDFEVLED